MDINEYRKRIFINSQYCTYYNVNNNTILAGILRSNGYRYSVRLPQDKLKQINKVYRKFTTILNCAVALEIILYIYIVIFPFYIQFMKLPFFFAVLLLSFIPLAGLYLTYILINSLYENYLTRYVGTFQRMKFKPEVRFIDDEMFKEYENTPRKSVYVLALMVLIFCSYIITPFVIKAFIDNEKFIMAENIANTYLTFVPVSPEVYAQRAYTKFKLKKYKEAVEDYTKANDFSLSDNFSNSILGVKIHYLPYKQMLEEFDKAIVQEKEKPAKYNLMYEKAIYLLKNKDYKAADNILNQILAKYEKREKVFFSPSAAYYHRSITRDVLGNITGAKQDLSTAKKMCPDCKFSQETSLIVSP